MIEIVDYATRDPFSFIAPKVADFSWSNRFQMVALDNHGDPTRKAQLIGRWEFHADRSRGHTVIQSTHTWVSGRVRRQGIARKLWRAGVERWKPIRVSVSIGSWRGLEFLARMRAELAGATTLDVDYGKNGQKLPDGHRVDEWPHWPTRAAEELERELARLRLESETIKRRSRLEVVK